MGHTATAFVGVPLPSNRTVALLCRVCDYCPPQHTAGGAILAPCLPPQGREEGRAGTLGVYRDPALTSASVESDDVFRDSSTQTLVRHCIIPSMMQSDRACDDIGQPQHRLLIGMSEIHMQLVWDRML